MKRKLVLIGSLVFVLTGLLYAIGGRERYRFRDPHPVAYYKMDDNAANTTVIDSTGTKNGVYMDYQTPVNTSTGSVAGKINSALDLDSDEWINIGNHGASIKSIAIWVNPDSVSVTAYLMRVGSLAGTSVYITILNGTVTKNGLTTGTQVIYVDGIVGSTVTANWHLVVLTSTVGVTASHLQMGKQSTSGCFDGLVDNLMLFTDVLTPKEVKRLYNNGRGTESLQPGRRERYRF